MGGDPRRGSDCCGRGRAEDGGRRSEQQTLPRQVAPRDITESHSTQDPAPAEGEMPASPHRAKSGNTELE